MTAGSILSHHSESVRSTNFPASIICWVPIVVISGISPAANFVCRAEVPSFWNSCSTFTLSLSALKRSTASLYQSTISTLPLKNLTVTGSPAASELSPEEPAALFACGSGFALAAGGQGHSHCAGQQRGADAFSKMIHNLPPLLCRTYLLPRFQCKTNREI